MRKPSPAIYRRTNWRCYKAALKPRGSVLIWFDPATLWLAEPGGKRGGSATFPTRPCKPAWCQRRCSACRFGKPRGWSQPCGACRAGLAGAGFQHPVSSPERSEPRHPLAAQHWRAASLDRQHGDQGRGRVVRQETRAFQAPTMAQGSLGDGREHAGNQGDQG